MLELKVLVTEEAAPPLVSSPAFNVAETAFTNGVLGAIGIATGVIAARWLGPEGRGELAAIQMWPSILATVAMLGMGEAVVYFCARRPSESRRYLVTAALIALLVMPIFAAVGYLLMPHLLSRQSPRIVQAARMYLILLPVYAFVGLPYQLLRGVQRYRLWNVMRVIPSLLWMLVLVVVVSLRISDPPRMTATYILLLSCAGPLLSWIVWKNAAGSPRPTAATAREMVSFGLPSVAGTLPQFFNLKLDQLIVTAMVAPRELGVYMAAVAWGASIPMLSSAVALIVSTQIAAGTSDSERSGRFGRGVRGAAWLIVAAVAVLGAATPFGVTIAFGRAFQAAIIPAAILVVASGVNALNGVLEELLRGYGRPAATFWAESAAVAVGLPALLLLVPRAGLRGAAIASLMGYLAGTTVLLVQSRRVADLRLREVLDLRGFLSSIVAALRHRPVPALTSK